MKITKSEMRLLADVLNGVGTSIECDPSYLGLMAGDGGAVKDASVIGRDQDGRVLLSGSTVCSGLEHEVYDSIRLNSVDRKWNVDGFDLIHKIREMRPDQREHLIRHIAAVWQRNDAHFERDLDSYQLPE